MRGAQSFQQLLAFGWWARPWRGLRNENPTQAEAFSSQGVKNLTNRRRRDRWGASRIFPQKSEFFFCWTPPPRRQAHHMRKLRTARMNYEPLDASQFTQLDPSEFKTIDPSEFKTID